MRAGALRDRVRIKHDTSDTNDPDTAYTDLYVNEPAQITEVSGGESFRGRQLEGHVKAIVVIRYRSDVTEKMQIVGMSLPFLDAVFHIAAVKIQRRGPMPITMELECTR